MKRQEMYTVFANTVGTMDSLEQEIKHVALVTGDLETTMEFFARGHEMVHRNIFDALNNVYVELTGGQL